MIKTAMILAAGRGERMRPLTNDTPKPLLDVNGQRLIEYHLYALANSGIENIVINLSYKGSMIKSFLGDGSRYQLNIQYSEEGDHALETAGGIIHALPLLGDEPFIVVNADIWTDFPFADLLLPTEKLASLILVNNPEHHPCGDFSIDQNSLVRNQGQTMHTYSGIGAYHPKLFTHYTPGKRPLKPILLDAMKHNLIYGQLYEGLWQDIGTPQRLEQIRNNHKNNI